MYHILGQVSYPVFISGVFIFFILASIFSFIVGIGLATRSTTMLRFFNFMNKSYSTRRMMKPLTSPHYIEPALLKHSRALGVAITLGAIVSIAMLKDLDPFLFQPMYSGWFGEETTEILAGYTHMFLLVGNALCIVVGVLLLFFPQVLTSVERYTDKWYTFRKQTRALHEVQFDVDHWVLQHPTVTGVTLSLLSLGLGLSMYMRL
jgi:hypothetical protein